MFPAFPTGIARTSGASSNCSTISNAPVFCPSILNGLTEFTNSISSSFCAISLTISNASSKLPSIETISAPYMTACESLPKAIFPSGITTIAFKPARAA